MIALATAVFFVIAEEGPIPVFIVDTYDVCVRMLNSSMADASCAEVKKPRHD